MKQKQPRKPKDIETGTSRTKGQEKNHQLDSSSTHSNVSATSGGTTFTREDGQSLFTSLTESFISDMKSQTDPVLQHNQTLMALVASQADMRAE
jgi:hypothetical protein